VTGRAREAVALSVGLSFVFWLLREQSYSGDWQNWVRFVEDGLWYRLREPVCLVIYQIGYAALAPLGVSAKDTLALVNCAAGSASLVIALATLRRLSPDGRSTWLAFVGFGLSYGVVGVFFGHLEHYAIMSLGVFAYIHCAIRYLDGDGSLAAAGLVLGLLLATHLMAAWLVPSLLVLPWLRVNRGGWAELLPAIGTLAAPNVVAWVVILAFYYAGSVPAIFEDLATGAWSKRHYGVGNALGGGDVKRFLEIGEIFAVPHFRSTAALLLLYSPLALVALPVLCIASSEARAQIAGTAVGRFFLSLAIPYTLFVLTWDAGLGPVRDWDLFSHLTIFLLFLTLIGAMAAPRRIAAIAVGLGLVASLAVTSVVVAESADPNGRTGVELLLGALGEETEPQRTRRSGRRPRG